jgi:hypothetical protein
MGIIAASDIREISANRGLYPVDLTLSEESLLRWLRRRLISKTRAYFIEILQSLGLNWIDLKGILDASKGLSLTDSYWIVKEGFQGSFSNHNLFENKFSEILGIGSFHRKTRNR